MLRLTANYRLCGVALAALTLALPLRAEAPTGYTFVDLGSANGSYSDGVAINATGQAAGSARFASRKPIHAVRWTGKTMTDLDPQGIHESRGYAINSIGQVAGYVFIKGDVYRHAVLWTGTTIVDINPPGGRDSLAQAINDSGQATGIVTPPGRNWLRAFRYDGSSRTILETLGGTNGGGFSINSRGQIAGYAALERDLVVHAVIWTGLHITDLGALTGRNSCGLSINTAGQVAGFYKGADGIAHAALWTEAAPPPLPEAPLAQGTGRHSVACAPLPTEMKGVDLGALGGSESKAYSINASGDIVGYAVNSLGVHVAFLYTDGKMVDLNKFLPANSEWKLTDAFSISDSGWIIGSGRFRGETRAFMLKPVTAPKTP